MKEAQQITCQSSHTCTRDPDAWTDDTQAGDHDPTSTRSRRPRQGTTPNGDGRTRSHPTNPPTTSPRFKSGKPSHSACVHREATGRDRTLLLSTRTWERRDTVPLKVQGQLKGLDQEACLLLIYESGRIRENKSQSLSILLKGFFNCVVLDSEPTESVPRRMRQAIERNIDEICPNRNPQSRLQHENLDVRSVGMTRPWRGVALFDETCDLTDEDAQEATV